MRLARPVYEGLPMAYMLIGAAAIGVAYLDPEGTLPFGAFCLGIVVETAALVVFLRRRDHRARRRDYPGASIEPPPVKSCR